MVKLLSIARWIIAMVLLWCGVRFNDILPAYVAEILMYMKISA